MVNPKNDQRKFQRYETDIKVHFVCPYEFRTEVDFSLDSELTEDEHPPKYIGFSKDISVQGLSFESNKELQVGDVLWVELHLPNITETIYMQGQVRWSQLATLTPEAPKTYLTGLQVTVVDGVDVEQTVYFDEKYRIMWSELLERVLGSFAKVHKNKT